MSEIMLLSDIQWSFRQEVKRSFLDELIDYNSEKDIEAVKIYALATLPMKNFFIKVSLTIPDIEYNWREQEILIINPNSSGELLLLDLLFNCHSVLYPFMTLSDYDSHYFEGLIRIASPKNALKLVLGS
jgi:hypothetical protein